MSPLKQENETAKEYSESAEQAISNSAIKVGPSSLDTKQDNITPYLMTLTSLSSSAISYILLHDKKCGLISLGISGLYGAAVYAFKNGYYDYGNHITLLSSLGTMFACLPVGLRTRHPSYLILGVGASLATMADGFRMYPFK